MFEDRTEMERFRLCLWPIRYSGRGQMEWTALFCFGVGRKFKTTRLLEGCRSDRLSALLRESHLASFFIKRSDCFAKDLKEASSFSEENKVCAAEISKGFNWNNKSRLSSRCRFISTGLI